jgi:hypothetical protein
VAPTLFAVFGVRYPPLVLCQFITNILVSDGIVGAKTLFAVMNTGVSLTERKELTERNLQRR